MKYTYQELINCVEREIRMREKFYPKWVQNKRMTREQANKEIEMMNEILSILKRQKELLDISGEIDIIP